ncbi:PIN domain-containing protein [Methylocystis sp. Sn-Cys]|uniref:PIN domain-containing protein n=1 Tax=Methylocystis sp. Sn-Cys TaxID=1701263 RepID=UPI00192483A4|nr:PIN domain-containing protein [Methylocystis sp. Sn-Cys]
MTDSVAGFLDTNILLYSISRDPAENAKRERAIALLDRDDWRLSVQVLQEFYVQATRPSRADPLPHHIAAGLVRTWMRFRVQDVTSEILIAALSIKARYGFSYWDAAIIAAAIAQGCGELYSEDMSHGQVIEGVRIIDPFR